MLYSGGKDSTLALLKASKFHEVVCLLLIIPSSDESYMFHRPNVGFVKFQAKAMGLPLIETTTKGEKEKELEDLKKLVKHAIAKHSIEGLVTGAIKSAYQASRMQRICYELGLWCFNPLWANDEVKLAREVVEHGIEAIITMVASYPLGKEMLGLPYSKALPKLLEFKKKHGISLLGEGGEFETFVLDAPIFKKRIEVVEWSVEYSSFRGILKFKKVRLVEKDDTDS